MEVGTDAVIPDGVSVKADNEASVDAADRLAGLSKKKIEEKKKGRKGGKHLDLK